MYHVKTYCEDAGEIMFEEVLKHGYITATELIIKSYKRIQDSPCKYISFQYYFKYTYFLFFFRFIIRGNNIYVLLII